MAGDFLPVWGGAVRSLPPGHGNVRPGRPGPDVIEEFLTLVRTGYGKYRAADMLGWEWPEIEDVIGADTALVRRFESAQQVRLDEVEEAAYEAAVAGNVAAQKFVLTNRRPEEWSDGAVLAQRVIRSHAEEEAEQAALETEKRRDSLHEALMDRITGVLSADLDRSSISDDPDE